MIATEMENVTIFNASVMKDLKEKNAIEKDVKLNAKTGAIVLMVNALARQGSKENHVLKKFV